jgi:uncharacterized protein
VIKFINKLAGFLRIYNGEHPLDGTFIHPENYPHLEKWAKDNNVKLSALVEEPEVIQKLSQDSGLKAELGEHTFDDIIKSLRAPKQDPRSEFKPVEFRKDVRKMEDLEIGQWYTGIVNNITNFGAFVDIGLKESGLLHVSQISDQFVQNPMDLFKKWGETVKVRVIELDLERKRIALSRKSEDGKGNASGVQSQPKKSKGKAHAQPQIKNNAFAGLANLKLK